MKNKLLFILLLLIIPFSVFGKELEIHSNSALLINTSTSEIVFSVNTDTRIQVASLNKIMTTLVALENIKDLDEVIVIPKFSLDKLSDLNLSVAGFYEGQEVTYRDLLYGIMLPSGADASVLIAYFISGSEDNFIKLMNNRANALGLANTNYMNVYGLDDDNQYSTLLDVANLLKTALLNKDFYDMFTSDHYLSSDKSFTLYSTLNYYVNNYDVSDKYISGSKTGYEDLAGLCMASISEYNNSSLMLITAGAEGSDYFPLNVADAHSVYDYYLNNYSVSTLISKGKLIGSINVKNSSKSKLELLMEEDVKAYLPNEFNNSDIDIIFSGEKISVGSLRGDLAGSYKIIYMNKEIYSGKVFLKEDVKFSLISFVIDNILFVVLGMVLLVIVLIMYIKIRRKNAS